MYKSARVHSQLGLEPSWWYVAFLAVPSSEESPFFHLWLVLCHNKCYWGCLGTWRGLVP